MVRRTSKRRIVLFGLLSGGLFGLGQGVLRHNVWVGLVSGLFFGVVMTFVMRHVWGSTALDGLSRQERRTISRAMRRGEPVEDPRLARRLVDQVDATLAMPVSIPVLGVVFGLLALLGLVVVVMGALSGGGVGGGLLVLVFGLVLLLGLLPLIARQRTRFRRSREATLERHPDVYSTAD